MGGLEVPDSPSYSPGVGWEAFMDLGFIAQMLVVLGMAVALAATLAYHPTTRRKAVTLEEFEQPKTFIIYALVGAIVTIVVRNMPSMALVVFGIGGLLRFRTNAGEAKDTGRVILVTIIGLACGLELYVVAVMTTLLSWLLIFALEQRPVERLVVQGLDAEGIQRASADYPAVLRELGCRVIGEDRRAKKGSVAITYRAPGKLTRAQIETKLGELPNSSGDTLRWESA